MNPLHCLNSYYRKSSFCFTVTPQQIVKFSALILNKLLKSPVDATDLFLLRSWYFFQNADFPISECLDIIDLFAQQFLLVTEILRIHQGCNDKPHMRPSPCKLGTEVVLTNTFWWTLFRIIDSSDKRPWPSGVKGNVFLLMQSLYYQRHVVIHYLVNASLQSWFKNRLELLIHSFFYECIKCQTVTNQTV